MQAEEPRRLHVPLPAPETLVKVAFAVPVLLTAGRLRRLEVPQEAGKASPRLRLVRRKLAEPAVVNAAVRAPAVQEPADPPALLVRAVAWPRLHRPDPQ